MVFGYVQGQSACNPTSDPTSMFFFFKETRQFVEGTHTKAVDDGMSLVSEPEDFDKRWPASWNKHGLEQLVLPSEITPRSGLPYM